MNWKKYLFINSLLFLLAACGPGNQRPIEAGNVSLGQELSNSYTLTGERKNVALRICYAYRSKRVEFRSNHLDDTFQFSVKNRPCNGDESNKTISATLKEPLLSQPMIFDSSERTMTWFNSVNTDADGVLGNFCDSIIRGDTVTNLLSSSSSQQEVVEFSVGTDSDHYTILTALKNFSGSFVVAKRVVYYVQTTNQSAPQVGDDYRITQEEQCASGSENETFLIEQSTSNYP
jgi:hypothetical protein